MKAEGVDIYNLTITGGVACTLTESYGATGICPKVIVEAKQPPLCVRERCGKPGGGKGLLIQTNVAGTIATSNDQFVVLDHHPADSRLDIANDQTSTQTLTSRMGTWGGNVPLIMEKKNDLCAEKQSKSRDHTG